MAATHTEARSRWFQLVTSRRIRRSATPWSMAMVAIVGLAFSFDGRPADAEEPNVNSPVISSARDAQRDNARHAVTAVSGERRTLEPVATLTWKELGDLESLHMATAGRIAAHHGPHPPVRDIGPFPDDWESLEAYRTSIRDAALQRAKAPGPQVNASAQLPLGTNFLALPDNGSSIPPDTMGAAGPNHLVTMLNSQVRIQDKTGAVLGIDVGLGTFFGATGMSDPRIRYDASTGRWLAMALSGFVTPASAVHFAVSSTSDPTGAWTFYVIDADPSDIDWADFPGLGFNQTWIAITANMWSNAAPTFSGPAMWVIDKSTALAGGALTLTAFPVGFDVAGGPGFSVHPCVTYGASAALFLTDQSFFSSVGTNLLRMSQITGTGPAPSWSPVPGSAFPNTGLFPVTNLFSYATINAPQLGTPVRIDSGGTHIRTAPTYRNGHIWTLHGGGLPNRSSIFWYELDPLAMMATGLPIVQSGVIDGGDDVFHTYGSLAVNAANDVCVGFSRTDSTKFIEAAFTGRLGANIPGIMNPVTVLKLGEASYVKTFGGSRIRWGDYSATVVDPTDDLTFWTLQEYAALDVGPTASDDKWGTWWGSKTPGVLETTPKFSQPPTCACDADVDGNGGLEIADVTVVQNCVLGDCSGCVNTCDVDCDGDIDADDVNTVVCRFGGDPADFCCTPHLGEDIESNIDWVDMEPNVVVADDFTSDGRPITGVRWWGSVLKQPCDKPAIAGDDCWSTACDGNTVVEFGGTTVPALPADWFGPGSDPFTGTVTLGGASGFADTIITRLNDMCLSGDVPVSDHTPIQLQQLDLQSCQSITVTYNGGQNPTPFDVVVSAAAVQPIGDLWATKDNVNGGTFDSNLPIEVIIEFIGPAVASSLQTPLTLTSLGLPWVQTEPIFAVCGFGGGFFPGYDKNEPTCCPESCHQGPAPGHDHCVTPPKCPKCEPDLPKECGNPGLCQVCDNTTNPDCECGTRYDGTTACFYGPTANGILCSTNPFPDNFCSGVVGTGGKCFVDACRLDFCAVNCPDRVPANRGATEPGLVVEAGVPGVKCAPIGQDGFTTLCDPDNPTRFDFSQFTLPADLFGPGSDPFDGVVDFGGPGDFPADTIVQRNAEMCFDGPLPISQTIPIEIVQMELESCAPITVTFNGGQDPTLFDVFVELDPNVAQQQGSMTATKETPTGGTYTASLPVAARFMFQEVAGPIIAGPLPAPPITLQTDPPGFWLQDCCDTGTGSTGFFPGWKDDKEGLTGPCCKPTCHPNPAGGHEHCVWPPDCEHCPVKPPPGGGNDLNWDGWFISFHLPLDFDSTKDPNAYQHDDGGQDNGIGLTDGGDVLWLNQFNVIPGLETINSISVTWWSQLAAGTPTTVLLYDDPNNDGDPSDAVLITTANTPAVPGGTTVVDIPDTIAGAAGDSFFVAASITHLAGEFPAGIDDTSSAGRSWIVGGGPGTLDANNLPNNALPPTTVDDVGLPGNWLIRAGVRLTATDQSEPLALYYCDGDVVDILDTPLPACDGHPVEEYRVDLDDCCLVHANVDPRSGAVPAVKQAFFEDKCSEYLIDIEAVVGHEFTQDPATLECIESPTGKTLSGPFWGWHTSPFDNGTAPAVQTSVKMGIGVCIGGADDGLPCAVNGDCAGGICDGPWLYGPWTPVVPTCSVPNMAFELITEVPTLAPDCNFNWIPDQCEPDCQPNGIPDDCDIASGTSPDNNGNGIPDECECCASGAPRDVKIPVSLGGPLATLTANRTLAIQAGGDPGCTDQAVRVIFSNLAPPYDLWNGEELWLGAPVLTSELGSTPTPTVGFADNFWSQLQCMPECRDDWAGFGDIYVYHEGVMPGSAYDIQVVDCTDPACLNDPAVFSPALLLDTSAYGDILGNCSQVPCSPPGGLPVNVNDALGVLSAFSTSPGAPRKARADIEPADLDRKINVSDALRVLNAFSGVPYPETPSVTDPCP